MMPSRGLASVARGSAGRLFQGPCRNLSSVSRHGAQTLVERTNGPSSLRSRWSAPISAPIALSRNARYASSLPPASREGFWAKAAPPASPTQVDSGAAATSQSPLDTAAAVTTDPVAPFEPISFPDLDSITLDTVDTLSASEMAKIPERIGYLHELGIQYGWGPTSALQWCLEHIHVYTGMPWWGSIAATAIVFRILTFPLYLRASDVTARQTALNPLTKPLMDQMQEARRSGDHALMMALVSQMQDMRKRAGISLTATLIPSIVQGVFAYCGFKLLRAMTTLPVPAFTTDGPLWLHDLTLKDPYLLLPIAMAGLVHWLVRSGGETAGSDPNLMNPMMFKFLVWGMPAFMVIFMGFQPGALCIWFAASTIISVAQSFLLRNPAVRSRLGLAPLYKVPPKEAATNKAAPSPWSTLEFAAATAREAPKDNTTTIVQGKSRREVAAASAPAITIKSVHKTGTYQAPTLNRVPAANRQSRIVDAAKAARSAVQETVEGAIASDSSVASSTASVVNEASTEGKDVKEVRKPESRHGGPTRKQDAAAGSKGSRKRS